MTIDQIDKKVKELSSTCSIDHAKSLIDSLVALLGVSETKKAVLLTHKSIDREVVRFVKAPMMRNQAAAYTIPHETEEPIDLKLFWVKNTTKANLSWLVALTPNFEDDPDNNENANIGIDFVLSESCDRLFIILSYKLKLRVLELHEALSHTQKEILENWIKIRRDLDPTSETYKEQLRSHLWKSFDFEPVNKFFYSQLIQQFDHLVSHLKINNTPEEEAKMFAVKLFGRTLFLWFLKKKEFLNPKISYFEVKGEDNQTKYYQDFLEPLFFEVLNSEIRGRKYPDDITPFLNGGLFEPTSTDFYKDSNLTFPDGFFTQFYALLNKFNFTVDEGTSDYEQVAVDPEMLGRVFENLLASINPETETSARKAKGAFYTPRTIVDYLCKQSLIEYLKTKLPETPVRDQRIEELVTMNESDFREQDHNKRRDWKRDLGKEEVIKALDELRVLDPAVGSGAFPMGMLQLLVKVYSRIETANEKDLAGLKREILSRSLYGVDIDQMAIQISRLRAWLSILVDMQDLRKVEPLPNLDFKFVCANTLIPLAEGTQDNLFDKHQLKEELIDIRNKYYEATKKTDKKKLRDQYLAKIHDGGLFAELESERQRQLKDYNPFDSLNSSGFYDPSLMHGVNNFQIVIGNPPYVTLSLGKGQKSLSKKDLDLLLKTYSDIKEYKNNLFSFFIRSAFNFVDKDCGSVCYIVPNSFLYNSSFSKLRKFVVENLKIGYLVDIKDKVFESAEIGGNCIFILNTNKINNDINSIILRKTDELLNPIYTTLDQSTINANNSYAINLDLETSKIIKSIENSSGILLKHCKFYNGIKSGDNKKYLKDNQESSIDKPVIRGRDIDKYTPARLSHFIHFDKSKLWSNTNVDNFNKIPKILIRQTGDTLTATLDESGALYMDTVHGIFDTDVDILYILGLLNSKVIDYWHKIITSESGRTFAEVKIVNLKKIPIKLIDKVTQDKIVTLVQKILDIKKKEHSSETAVLEKEIDELVMDLYNLTPEEKEIIRNS